ncbi:MAG: SprB repeat-containing protein [Bacteroidota bacterium]
MANSTSTDSSSTTTAQSTLSTLQQELFTILDNLQTQAQADATAESTVVNTLIQAEGSLVSKSTSFGGPSPNFTSPTWAGSTGPNGALSYKTTFKPVIHTVLSQKTAAQDEQAINMTELQTNLINVFKGVYNNFPPTGKQINAAMTTEIGIPWVQDSIIQASNYLAVLDQENLLYTLTTAILGGSGLPTDPTWDGSNDAYGPWITAQIQAYFNQPQNQPQGQDVTKLTSQVLNLLQSTMSQYQLSNEESVMEWVSTTISTAPSTVPITNLQKQELVGALEQAIMNMFPQPDKSFFYSNLQTVLQQNIFNPPVSTVLSSKITPPSPLQVLLTNVNSTKANGGSITAYASGGQVPTSGYSYQWEQITNPGQKPVVTTNVGTPTTTPSVSSLAPGQYRVLVTDSKTTITSDPIEVFNSNLNLKLKANSQQNVSTNGGSDGSATVSATGGSGSLTFSWKNLDSQATQNGTTTGKSNSATGLTAGTYLVTVTDSASPAVSAAIQVVITQPQITSFTNNGIKYVIEKILGVTTNTNNPTNVANMALATQLESSIKEVIQLAIANTFNNLVEYGAQGQLMSSTYDYQMISRIADYVSALIDELKADYNNYIPTNSSNALTAAQNITSTAVAFRDFADSLSGITSAFKSELNHPTNSNAQAGQPGYTYNQISNLINHYPSNNNLANLSQLANKIYLSTSAGDVPLIKTAELEGVTLASSTAGLNTSLSKLLTGEQSTALSSLTKMKQNAKTNFDTAYTNFNTAATAYFSELDNYISANQTFNYDMLKLNAVNNALNELTKAIEQGVNHASFTNANAKT